MKSGMKQPPTSAELIAMTPADLLRSAAVIRDSGHGAVQSWSPKIFIPLTKLCRNYCHYCTFSRPPERHEPAFLTRNEVLAIARAGASAGCSEALFTLGDKPELRFPAAQAELDAMGHATTIEYLIECCKLVRDQTGLLPHVNAGVMSRSEMAALRDVSVSQGLMLETISDRLSAKGGPHYRSPDKDPALRLEMIRMAGELAIPFTTGILIGIGETREERIAALEAIYELHAEYGHVQEIIIQNFRAKERTPMADAPEPTLDDLMWTIAAARHIFGPSMNIQAPPNLSETNFGKLIDAGINDWGGISPVTPDHVNPERPWPEVALLENETALKGRNLVARLPLYPDYLADAERWLAPAMRKPVMVLADSEGFFRRDSWSPGIPLPAERANPAPAIGVIRPELARAVESAATGTQPSEADIITLFSARGPEVALVCDAANDLRQRVNGDTVTYVVNRNINYTNICAYKCGFCAFSKGSTDDALRGKPYDLDHGEIARRVVEAWERGASEVCLQGGIHPAYTGETYLALARTVKQAVPQIHLHAFSPLEIHHGATTLGLSLKDYLLRLKDAGLDTLPGTAAEILDDEVREQICPDKLTTAQWLEVVETAHSIGLRSTATIMFGHVDRPVHWARHLLHIRALQQRTGGLTEFVPLPFVHMEAPMALRGAVRRGPTLREVRLMHAVSRLVLHGLVPSIQASWVKLGNAGLELCLNSGVNDLGGTLMNESISRAAGTQHGQEMPPQDMDGLVRALGRTPRQRTTLYDDVIETIQARGHKAAPLAPMIQTPPRKRAGKKLQEGKIHEYAK